MGGLAALGGVVQAVGAFGAASSAQSMGNYEAAARMRAARFEAKQLEQQAKEEEGAAALRSREIFRDKRYLQSSQLAKAAASGIGATSPTVIDIMEDTEKRASMLAETEITSGKRAAKSIRKQAKATLISGATGAHLARMQGNAQAQSYRMSGVSSLISSAGSAYARYR